MSAKIILANFQDVNRRVGRVELFYTNNSFASLLALNEIFPGQIGQIWHITGGIS